MLRVQSLSVRHGKADILTDISFDVTNNQIKGMLGCNGAGKSTLLKCITGLWPKYDGKIECEAPFFFLPEKFSPPNNFTGVQFIRHALSIEKAKPARAAIDDMAAKLGLSGADMNGKPIGQYSKGMMQKIGLICAFLSPKPLIILDEPMSGLDPQVRAAVKSEIKALKQTGKSVLFSSHILEDIESVCDHFMIIDNGQKCFDGDMKTCLAETGEKTLEKAFLAKINKVDDNNAENTG